MQCDFVASNFNLLLALILLPRPRLERVRYSARCARICANICHSEDVVEPLISLVAKIFGSTLGFKLLLMVGAFAVAISKFISDFLNPAEKKLVDSTTNRIEDIKIDDEASVRDAIDALYEDQTSGTKGSAGPLDQNQVTREAPRGALNEST